MYVQPKQRVENKDKAFYIENVNYISNLATFSDNNFSDLHRIAKAVSGELDNSDYDIILNPYNADEDNIPNTRARLRNYSIIDPVIKARLGERSKSPFNLQAINLNAEDENNYLESLDIKIKAVMQQDAINQLNANGIPTGQESKEIPSYRDVVKQHNESWKDKNAILAQTAIDFIKYDQDLFDKYMMMYEDWLYYGRCFSGKDVIFNNVNSYRISPFNIWFSLNPNSNFIEDCQMIRVRYALSINEIIDKYREYLTDDDYNWLETKVNAISNISIPTLRNLDLSLKEDMDDYNNYDIGILNRGLIWVNHDVWKSQKKIGHLIYIDELGQLQVKDVDSNYKLNKKAGDLEIKWEWIGEWHECHSIEDTIYFAYGAGLEQRRDLNNESIVKLPYNGRIKLDPLGNIKSDVKDGLVYQCLFNIYHFNREKIINKNRDKILLMPIGLIPKQFGANGKDPFDTFINYLDNFSLGFFDETRPNAAAVLSALKQIDLGLGNYIESMTNILESVKQEYWDCVGFNRQRFGETYASDGKGVNEQALFRSAILTADDDRKFDKFIEKDANGLIDYAKIAWINGKKAYYQLSDGERMLLNITTEEDLISFSSSSLGIFLVNTVKEAEKLKMLKDYAFSMVQKGEIGDDTVAELIDAESFAKIKKILVDAKEAKRAYDNYVQQQEHNNQQQIQQMVIEDRERDRQAKHQDIEVTANATIEAAMIKAQATVLGFDMGKDSQKDMMDIEEQHHKRMMDYKNSNLKERQLNQKTEQDNKKLQLEADKIKSQEKIARMTKNKK